MSQLRGTTEADLEVCLVSVITAFAVPGGTRTRDPRLLDAERLMLTGKLIHRLLINNLRVGVVYRGNNPR